MKTKYQNALEELVANYDDDMLLLAYVDRFYPECELLEDASELPDKMRREYTLCRKWPSDTLSALVIDWAKDELNARAADCPDQSGDAVTLALEILIDDESYFDRACSKCESEARDYQETINGNLRNR